MAARPIQRMIPLCLAKARRKKVGLWRTLTDMYFYIWRYIYIYILQDHRVVTSFLQVIVSQQHKTISDRSASLNLDSLHCTSQVIYIIQRVYIKCIVIIFFFLKFPFRHNQNVSFYPFN